MDTKWKRSRAALSFAAFALGVTLVIYSLASWTALFISADWDSLRGGARYQDTQEFRSTIASRLEDLLAVATGGKSWASYGTAEGYLYFSDSVIEQTILAQMALPGGTAETAVGLAGDGEESRLTVEDHMAALAQDKNLLYAVVYDQRLLYTNIEDFAGRVGRSWNLADFGAALDPKEYDFTLWFNRGGDGKVNIMQDGHEVDVYGSGVYTEDCDWYVPGYTNFTVDDSTRKAVVFLAAAREPKLYITGNYAGDGAAQYGGHLYYMQRSLSQQKRQLQASGFRLAIGAALLVWAFLWREDKRRAERAVARLLGRVWLEVKVPAALLALAVLFLYGGRSYLQDLRWMLYELDGFTALSESGWYLARAALNGTFAADCFWVLYLAALDGRANRGRQKTPLLDSLRTSGLRLPIQKRLVRRGRWMALTALAALLAFEAALVRQVNSYYEGGLGWAVTMGVLAAALALWLAVNVLALRKNRRLAQDLGALTAQIEAVRAGDLIHPLALPEDADLRRAAESLNELQRGLDEALREQMQSERMKVELVANVSHDLKTPLTSIISYIELLKQEPDLPAHVQDFVRILDEKAARLKAIVQDVFDISKAASGQLPIQPEALDLAKLLRQTLADMDSAIAASGLTLRVSLPEQPVPIRADGQRLYRVFQNLLQNALQYSLPGSRVFLTLTAADGTAEAQVRNTSAAELADSVDFTARFVRGDASRTDGGSGLGLSIAKSFTEACGGQFSVETDADLFTARVRFPLEEQT